MICPLCKGKAVVSERISEAYRRLRSAFVLPPVAPETPVMCPVCLGYGHVSAKITEVL